jgi:two-component system cell cycle sensor histidine kinase/response regulator CckA
VHGVRRHERVFLVASKSTRKPARSDAGPEGAAKPVTILLVEDDPMIRSLVVRMLEQEGCQVLEASTGEEACQHAERHKGPIHLLLTDMMMPGMSGRQLAERVLAVRPEIKVLLMSGFSDDAGLRRGIQDKSIAFIPKPFVPEALLSKIQEVLAFDISRCSVPSSCS